MSEEHIIQLPPIPRIIAHDAQGQVVLDVEPIDIDYALSYAQQGIEPAEMSKPENVAQWMGRFVVELNQMGQHGHKFTKTEGHLITTRNDAVMKELKKKSDG